MEPVAGDVVPQLKIKRVIESGGLPEGSPLRIAVATDQILGAHLDHRLLICVCAEANMPMFTRCKHIREYERSTKAVHHFTRVGRQVLLVGADEALAHVILQAKISTTKINDALLLYNVRFGLLNIVQDLEGTFNEYASLRDVMDDLLMAYCQAGEAMRLDECGHSYHLPLSSAVERGCEYTEEHAADIYSVGWRQMCATCAAALVPDDYNDGREKKMTSPDMKRHTITDSTSTLTVPAGGGYTTGGIISARPLPKKGP